MDDHQLKDLDPDSASDAARCLICLNTFSGQPVASPQHCNHVYCLVCITEWAKVRLCLGIQMIHSFYTVVNSGILNPIDFCILFVWSWTFLIDSFLCRLQIPVL